MSLSDGRFTVSAGLLGVDVSDIVAAGGGGNAILERRVTEIEKRILALEAETHKPSPDHPSEIPVE